MVEGENMNQSNALPVTNYVACPCQHCSGKIEFDASQLDPTENIAVPCPHCGLETKIFVPEQNVSPNISGDDFHLRPAREVEREEEIRKNRVLAEQNNIPAPGQKMPPAISHDSMELPSRTAEKFTPHDEKPKKVEGRDAIPSLIRKEEAGFRFEIADVEECNMENGNAAFIFYLTITNLEPKARIINLALATYVTDGGEQLEQNIWLNGYLINHGRIKGNAYRKAGLVFYKSHLKRISSGDTLYIEAVVPDKAKKLSIRFEEGPAQGNTPWINCGTDIEDFDVKPTPRVASKALTKGIERLEVFEEKFGIVLDKLSVNVSENYGSVTVVGEVHLKDGTSLAKNLTVVVVAYDSDGSIIGTGEATLYAQTFSGFDVLDITLYAADIGWLATRIRVFPKAHF